MTEFAANYHGDVRHIIGEVKGPDTGGAMYRATAAVYDEDTGKTRVTFDLVWPAEVLRQAPG